MRWARENEFDALIGASVDSLAWPGMNRDQVIAFLKALMAHESSFNPAARRAEAGGNDSVGLMQVRFSTAKSLGYPGPIGDPSDLSGLYAPGTNVFLGAKLVHQLLLSLGADISRVASAYNGGNRPQFGFGTRLTKEMTLCLARDTAGNCIRTFDAMPGQFGNQPYVDAVMHNYDYFWRQPPGGQAPDVGADSGTSEGASEIGLVLAVGMSVAMWLFMNRRKR